VSLCVTPTHQSQPPQPPQPTTSPRRCWRRLSTTPSSTGACSTRQRRRQRQRSRGTPTAQQQLVQAVQLAGQPAMAEQEQQQWVVVAQRCRAPQGAQQGLAS
jgi:hypothetical protein